VLRPDNSEEQPSCTRRLIGIVSVVVARLARPPVPASRSSWSNSPENAGCRSARFAPANPQRCSTRLQYRV